ncbi:MAG: CvpA family protein [Candidatus Omnitrophica bacterium]|nr:CvpA family protein [Candidatus Omnitrophota bacterium]
MKTFTHFLQMINWMDVAMLALLIRIVFIGVKTGFVTELFKLFGILCAVFVGLHYYTPLAVFISKKINWSFQILECTFFGLLVILVVVAVKYFRDGFLLIFRFETAHEGVNQWGSGLFSVIRALLLISLILFGSLLSRVEWLERQTMTSVSQKLALKVAPKTYSFLFHNLIGKIFTEERFNQEANNVVIHSSVSRGRF